MSEFSDGAGRGGAGGGVRADGVPSAVRGVPAHPERAVGNSQLPVSKMQAAAGAAAAVAVAGVSARNRQHENPTAVRQLPGRAERSARAHAICLPAVSGGACGRSCEAGRVYEFVVAVERAREWTGRAADGVRRGLAWQPCDGCHGRYGVE